MNLKILFHIKHRKARTQKFSYKKPVYAVRRFFACAANPVQSLLNKKRIPNNFYETRYRIKPWEKILEITANITNPYLILSDVLDI